MRTISSARDSHRGSDAEPGADAPQDADRGVRHEGRGDQAEDPDPGGPDDVGQALREQQRDERRGDRAGRRPGAHPQPAAQDHERRGEHREDGGSGEERVHAVKQPGLQPELRAHPGQGDGQGRHRLGGRPQPGPAHQRRRHHGRDGDQQRRDGAEDELVGQREEHEDHRRHGDQRGADAGEDRLERHRVARLVRARDGGAWDCGACVSRGRRRRGGRRRALGRGSRLIVPGPARPDAARRERAAVGHPGEGVRCGLLGAHLLEDPLAVEDCPLDGKRGRVQLDPALPTEVERAAPADGGAEGRAAGGAGQGVGQASQRVTYPRLFHEWQPGGPERPLGRRHATNRSRFHAKCVFYADAGRAVRPSRRASPAPWSSTSPGPASRTARGRGRRPR